MNEQKITGSLFQRMVVEGALAIAEKKEAANELNVFPVPDGDTGTNMYMTMHAAQEEMERLSEPTLRKAVDQTASALLRGARGNSGVSFPFPSVAWQKSSVKRKKLAAVILHWPCAKV